MGFSIGTGQGHSREQPWEQPADVGSSHGSGGLCAVPIWAGQDVGRSRGSASPPLVPPAGARFIRCPMLLGSLSAGLDVVDVDAKALKRVGQLGELGEGSLKVLDDFGGDDARRRKVVGVL